MTFEEWFEDFKKTIKPKAPADLVIKSKEAREYEMQFGAAEEYLRWWIEQNREDELAGKWR